MEQDTNVLAADEQITFDPSDFGIEEESETSEALESQETKEQEVEEKEADEPGETDTHDERGEEAEEDEIEVKFLGETRRLSKEEAKTLAQKGLNYDHLQEELEALKNNALYQAAIKGAKSLQMSEQDFANYLDERARDFQVKKISKERGIDEEAAKEVVSALRDKEKEAEGITSQISELKRENDELKEFKRINELKEQMRSEWKAFSEKHPQFKTMDDLPKEVKEDIKAGQDVDQAYIKYENAQLKSELKKREAAAKSPGAAKGNSSGEDEEDDFLKGFFGKY